MKDRYFALNISKYFGAEPCDCPTQETKQRLIYIYHLNYRIHNFGLKLVGCWN